MSKRLPKIDTKILNPGYQHGSNSVSYGVFSSTDLEASDNPIKHYKDYVTTGERASACYASLSSIIRTYKSKNNKAPTRLWNRINIIEQHHPDITPLLTIDECHAWITLCKEYGLLPDYIREESVKEDIKPDTYAMKSDHSILKYKGTILLDIEDISPALAYIYLASYRSLREDPGFVRSVLYLVKDLGVNFYMAYVFATVIAINSWGHHILSLSRPYGSIDVYRQGDNDPSSEINKKAAIDYIHCASAPLKLAIGIQRFVRDHRTYDQRVFGGEFRCGSTLDTVSTISHKMVFKDLFNNHIKDAVMSETDKEALKHLSRCLVKQTIKLNLKGASN